MSAQPALPTDPAGRETISETDLVTILANEGAGRDAAGALAELQRRNIVASRDLNRSLKRFETTSWILTVVLIALTAVLVIAAIRH